MKYEYLIWDYNGTIIDDAWVAVAAENVVLRENGLPEIDMEFYLRECEMPIENFYRKIYDFSKFDFAAIAHSFVKNYDLIAADAKPFPEVCSAIKRYSRLGIRQGVISGFETGRLEQSLKSFGLDGYFDFMSGSDDTSCGSKSERAVQVVKKHGYKPESTLFIGDMYHDHETARLVGADCVLIAKGHQGEQALKKHGGVTVLSGADELDDIIL